MVNSVTAFSTPFSPEEAQGLVGGGAGSADQENQEGCQESGGH